MSISAGVHSTLPKGSHVETKSMMFVSKILVSFSKVSVMTTTIQKCIV